MEHNNIDIADMVGAYPTCSNCGSLDVVRDAWAEWDLGSGDWRLKTTFDHFVCNACGEEITPVWSLNEEFRKKRIRRQNDALRNGSSQNSMVIITSGVRTLGNKFLHETNHAVASFDAFTEDNDPHGEHDFGAIDVQGEKLFWKIDYFDQSLSKLSPDPANPILTHRVLTIMLACEY